MRKEQDIEIRGEGRALPAERHVARPKVVGGGDAGPGRDNRALGHLQGRKAVPGGDLVVNGLAVRGDEVDLGRVEAGGG